MFRLNELFASRAGRALSEMLVCMDEVSPRIRAVITAA